MRRIDFTWGQNSTHLRQCALVYGKRHSLALLWTPWACCRSRWGLEWPTSRLRSDPATSPRTCINEISSCFRALRENCFVEPGWCLPLPHPTHLPWLQSNCSPWRQDTPQASERSVVAHMTTGSQTRSC